MIFSKRDFFKAITGGGVATNALLNAAGREVKELNLPRPEPATTDQLRNIGRGVFDVVDAMKYDRIRFDGAVIPESFEMFVAPIGDVCTYTGRRKTIAYTNMHTSGLFGTPAEFWLKRIHIFVDPATTVADARTFCEYGWTFRLLEKQYAAGSCAIDARSLSLTDIVALGKCGTPATRRSLEFEWTAGLYIPMYAHFRIQVASDREHELDRMGPGLDVAIGLEGLEIRPVQ
jgi:hypothetical protein